MGIYPRLTAALLALLVVSASAEAAKRQTVNHGQTARSMINGQSATTGSVSTPAGAAAFFGQAYTSYHTPGERFNAGDSVPNSGSGSGSTAKQPVDVKPGNFFNKARAGAMAVNALKGGIVAVATTAAVEWAINQIPGAEILDGQPVKTQGGPGPDSYWAANPYNSPTGYVPTKHGSATQACNYLSGTPSQSWYWTNRTQMTNSTQAQCYRDYSAAYCPSCGSVLTGYAQKHTLNCGEFGADAQTFTCNTSAPPKDPFSETDWNALNGLLGSMANNDWYQDLIKASCNGSLNPDGCYDSLVDNPFVIGPATQTGKSSSTTTTTTNPDGTTSSSTVTSTPSYSYTYGSNYYDYTTTTTTTTNNNGQVTTTVSTDTSEGTPDEDPASEEEKEEETDFSGEYTDAPFAEVTPFYEQQYPDGLQGVWDSASAQVSSSAFLQFLQSFAPSFSGTCPSWSLNFNIMQGAMFGTMDFISLCYIFDFVKIIFMVTAVFCARWIMFGG